MHWRQFKHQQYLNLETFRKSGESMKTPVWFVQDGEILYVSTMANSGKVKRIRNNGQVNMAACKMNGKVAGHGSQRRRARLPIRRYGRKQVNLLDKKYGLMKKLFDKQRAKKGCKTPSWRSS